MKTNELKTQLLENHQSFGKMINELNDTEVVFSNNGKWNSLQHTIHLTKSITVINLGLNTPKFLLKLLFGKAKKSKSYDEICRAYDLKLLAGAKAQLICHPKSKLKATKRKIVLQKLIQSVEKNIQFISKFSDSELDEIQLPHPFLGKLTIREMLYFMLYHLLCHQKSIEKMLGK